MIILFPLDYSGTGVDRAFTDEYNAAIENDISVVFFDQKLWDTQKQIKINSSMPKVDDIVIYRIHMSDFIYFLMFMNISKKMHRQFCNLGQRIGLTYLR